MKHLQAGRVKKLTRYAPTRFEMDLRAFNCHRTVTITIAQVSSAFWMAIVLPSVLCILVCKNLVVGECVG